MIFQRKEIEHILSSSPMQCTRALECSSCVVVVVVVCMRARRNGHVVTRTVHVFGALA